MKEGNHMNLLKITHDEEFIERTNLAMNRVENDDECWLSVDDFLKELKSWLDKTIISHLIFGVMIHVRIWKYLCKQ